MTQYPHMCRMDHPEIGHSESTDPEELACPVCAARAEVAALRGELAAARAKLNTNRCNSGHETLPLVLWECPACHDETRKERDALRERVEDLELMLRAALRGDFIDTKPQGWMVWPSEQGDPIDFDDDGTGLPLLTPEARAALRGEAAPQPRSET